MSRTFTLVVLNHHISVRDYVNIAGARIFWVGVFGKEHEATATELIAGGLVVTATLSNNQADEGYQSVVITLPPTPGDEDVYPVEAGVVFMTSDLTKNGASSRVEVFRATGTLVVADEVS